MIFIT